MLGGAVRFPVYRLLWQIFTANSVFNGNKFYKFLNQLKKQYIVTRNESKKQLLP